MGFITCYLPFLVVLPLNTCTSTLIPTDSSAGHGMLQRKWDALVRTFTWELTKSSRGCYPWLGWVWIYFVSEKLYKTKREMIGVLTQSRAIGLVHPQCHCLSVGSSSSFWTFRPLKYTCSYRLYLRYKWLENVVIFMSICTSGLNQSRIQLLENLYRKAPNICSVQRMKTTMLCLDLQL